MQRWRQRIHDTAQQLMTIRGLRTAAAVVAALHVLYVLAVPKIPIASDALVYHTMGSQLAAGHGYFNPLTGGPEVDFMPGYPLFISLVYRLGGAHPLALYVVQACLVGLVAALAQRLAARLAGPLAGLVAFVAMGVLPSLFVYAATVNAEVFLVTLVSLFLTVALPADPVTGTSTSWLAREPVRWILTGLLGGLLCLTKPELFLWLAVPVLGLWFSGHTKAAVAKGTLVIALAAATVVLPWTARNYVVFHRLIPFSVASGRTFWLSANAPPLYEFGSPPYVATRAACQQTVGENPSDIDRCLWKDAVRMVGEHPGSYVRAIVPRGLRLFVASHTESLPGFSKSFANAAHDGSYGTLTLKVLLLIIQTTFSFLGLWGLLTALPRTAKICLGYAAATKILVHALLFATARYGIPLSPIWAVSVGALAAKGHRLRWATTIGQRFARRNEVAPGATARHLSDA